MMRGFGKIVRGGWEFQWNFDRREQLLFYYLRIMEKRGVWLNEMS
jgi:hypothetical protein